MLPLSPPAYLEHQDEFAEWLALADEDELWDARAEAFEQGCQLDLLAIRETIAERFPEPDSE